MKPQVGPCTKGENNVIHDFQLLGKGDTGNEIFKKINFVLTYCHSVLIYIKLHSD